jgi:hypothetical protein
MAGMVLLLIIEGMIVSQFHATAQEGADYVIILGAQWKTSGPVMCYRNGWIKP